MKSDRAWRLVIAVVVALALCQSGCVATKYKLAKKNTPPVQSLDVAFPPAQPLRATLVALISFGGPGSWKREALWDEYVVTLENDGKLPLSIDSATLSDSAEVSYAAGSDPWALEKQSKQLEKQYRNGGEAFMRAAGPGFLIVGAGAATVSAAAGSGIFISAGAAGAAAATIFALPVYYTAVLGINHHNKKAVMTEFKRRRLTLPVTLAPGEIRTGSLFYPMVRSPGTLNLAWSSEGGAAAATLPLDFAHGLHVPAGPADQPVKQFTSATR